MDEEELSTLNKILSGQEMVKKFRFYSLFSLLCAGAFWFFKRNILPLPLPVVICVILTAITVFIFAIGATTISSYDKKNEKLGEKILENSISCFYFTLSAVFGTFEKSGFSLFLTFIFFAFLHFSLGQGCLKRFFWQKKIKRLNGEKGFS